MKIIAAVDDPVRLVDRVQMETLECRASHCGTVMPFGQPQLLAGLAQSVAQTRMLELGCGHGFATLWLAEVTSVPIDAIEADPVHAARARANFAEAGISERLTLYEEPVARVLPRLLGPYDLVLYEVWPVVPDDLVLLEDLVRPGGVLVSTLLGELNVTPPAEVWSTRVLAGAITVSTRL